MNTTIRKRFATLGLGIVMTLSVFSQRESKHEFTAWGSFGSANLNMDMNVGDQKSAVGGAFGLGYTYNFKKQKGWGISTGLEFAPYSNKLESINITDQFDMPNPAGGDPITYQSTLTDHSEKVSTSFISIPVMVQYQTKGEDQRFYAALGGKVGLPISKKSKSDATYFGVGKIDGKQKAFEKPGMDNDIDFKISYMLSAETGIRWYLAGSWRLYTGLFIDYGLNDIMKAENGKRMIEMDAEVADQFQHNSMLASKYYNKDTQKDESFVTKISPLSFGVKVKLAFALGAQPRYKVVRGKAEKWNPINYEAPAEKGKEQHQRYIDSKNYMPEDDFKKLDPKAIEKRIEEQERRATKIKEGQFMDKRFNENKKEEKKEEPVEQEEKYTIEFVD